MKRKIALFDFDKTVIYKDSIFILYDKTCRKVPGFRVKLFLHLVKDILSHNPKHLKTTVKETYLRMLEYYSPEELESFVEEDLMSYAFPEAIDTIHRLKEDGYFLMLVSASVDDYLRYVKNVLPFDHIIGTRTDAAFKLVGGNNKREQKVDNILAYLDANDIAIDYEHSVSFSDSLSADRPMMELTKNRYLINSSARADGFKHLRWERPSR
ncbi:MAG: HAD family hydrolase [Peptoniphilus sp.]|nr:HAD family hydrolase [Peptoniphilus sp.]MDD7363520.1 HAD family hydrolase [Bacillota bacterium]MDY6044777.1 HAD family hydrolase [Peptoniphilus sp.]